MFLRVTHASGDVSEIPVNYGLMLQVWDPADGVVATVALQGVTAVELDLTSPEPQDEPETVAAEEPPVEEPGGGEEPAAGEATQATAPEEPAGTASTGGGQSVAWHAPWKKSDG